MLENFPIKPIHPMHNVCSILNMELTIKGLADNEPLLKGFDVYYFPAMIWQVKFRCHHTILKNGKNRLVNATG